jgi:hypothetical protein
MNELDALLSQPLAPVADNGFSARVMGHVRRHEQRRIALWCLFVTAMAVLACALVPMNTLAAAMNQIVLTLGTSVQVGLAVVAALLTWAYDKKLYRYIADALF